MREYGRNEKPKGRRPKPPPKPEVQAIGASPISGVVPPVEHRWKPGQSGNPEGRPAAGATVKEWWNALQDATFPELVALANDPQTPAAKRAAAVDWLVAISPDRTSSGAPINGPAVERIIEHTAGKAAQALSINVNATQLSEEDLANIAASGSEGIAPPATRPALPD